MNVVICIVNPVKETEPTMVRFLTINFCWAGFMRSTRERPLSNPMGFQLPVHNPRPSGGSVSGCVDLEERFSSSPKIDNLIFIIPRLNGVFSFLQAMVFAKCCQAGQMFLVLIVGDQAKVSCMHMFRYGNL